MVGEKDLSYILKGSLACRREKRMNVKGFEDLLPKKIWFPSNGICFLFEVGDNTAQGEWGAEVTTVLGKVEKV